jgi:hypothetical protein
MPTPPEPTVGTVRSATSPEAGRCSTMVIVAVFLLLAVFSIVSLVLTEEDQRGVADPRDHPLLWRTIGHH